MRTIYQITQLHAPLTRLELYTKLLMVEINNNNDIGVSVLTSMLYKIEFKNDDPEVLPKLLAHARDVWLPKTLEFLGENSKHILEICDSLSSNLGLFI